jgi:hypothetical protein
MLQYYGAVVSPPAQPVVSPNGDGVAERQSLSYKLVRPSFVTATLIAPDGSTAWSEQLDRTPGRYPVAFPPPPAVPPAPGAAAEGAWQLKVEAVDDRGQSSTSTQRFWVNNTLSALRFDRGRLVVRPRGRARLRAGVSLSRAATVVVTVETKAGIPVARLLRRRVEPGRLLFSWDWHTFGGRRLAYGGSYVVRVRATNAVGTVELTRPLGVLRAAPLPQNRK